MIGQCPFFLKDFCKLFYNTSLYEHSNRFRTRQLRSSNVFVNNVPIASNSNTLVVYRLQERWTRIVSWPWPAPMLQRSTTCTLAKVASSLGQMPMWWSGTQTRRGERLYRVFVWWLIVATLTVQCCPVNRTISVSTQVQGGDFNLYEGMRCHGVPLVTISRGRLVCENGVFMCAEGSGKFYPQRTFPDFLYKKMVQREKVRQIVVVEQSQVEKWMQHLDAQ